MKFDKKILSICLTILVLQACYYDNEEELYSDIPACDTTNVDFGNEIQPIVNTNCAISGCHVPGTGRIDLTTYSGVIGIVDNGSLEQRVIVQMDMPPSGPLSDCDIKKIETWIANGPR